MIKFTRNRIFKSLSLNKLKIANNGLLNSLLKRNFVADSKKDNPSQAKDESGTEKKKEEQKETKHIYKQQPRKDSEGVDIIYDEQHSYKESNDDGMYVKEKVSYVYYENPISVYLGQSSQSAGKSEKSEKSDKDKSKETEEQKESKEQKEQKEQKESKDQNEKKEDKINKKELVKENKDIPEGNKKI